MPLCRSGFYECWRDCTSGKARRDRIAKAICFKGTERVPRSPWRDGSLERRHLMKRGGLPPLGALERADEIKPRDELYVVGRYKGDWIYAVRVIETGIELRGIGRLEIIRGLTAQRNREWLPFEIYTEQLNLISDQVRAPNDYNNAYIFRDYKFASRYQDVCALAPDELWAEFSDGRRTNTSVRPIL